MNAFLFLLIVVVVGCLGLLIAWVPRKRQRPMERQGDNAAPRLFRAMEGEAPVTGGVQHQADEVVIDFIRALNALYARTADGCPLCHEPVAALDQVGRCVYARPCGCRIGQGRVPAAWQTAESTPDEDEGEEEDWIHSTFDEDDEIPNGDDWQYDWRCPDCGDADCTGDCNGVYDGP